MKVFALFLFLLTQTSAAVTLFSISSKLPLEFRLMVDETQRKNYKLATWEDISILLEEISESLQNYSPHTLSSLLKNEIHIVYHELAPEILESFSQKRRESLLKRCSLLAYKKQDSFSKWLISAIALDAKRKSSSRSTLFWCHQYDARGQKSFERLAISFAPRVLKRVKRNLKLMDILSEEKADQKTKEKLIKSQKMP